MRHVGTRQASAGSDARCRSRSASPLSHWPLPPPLLANGSVTSTQLLAFGIDNGVIVSLTWCYYKPNEHRDDYSSLERIEADKTAAQAVEAPRTRTQGEWEFGSVLQCRRFG